MAQDTNQNSPQKQKDFNDAINEYRSLLRNISDELGKQRTHIADANAEYRKLDSIARQLQNTQEGISGLTSEQLDKLRGKYEISLKEIKNQAQQLLTQRGITNLTQTQLNYLKEKGKLDDKSSALLQGYLDDLELEKSFLETIEKATKKRLEYEGKVKELTGATGAILDGMKSSMNALGLSSMSNYLNIDAAKKAMEEEADAIARGEKEGGKMSVRMAGLKTLAEGLNKSLFSTEAVIGFIVKQLAQGSQNMADFRKQTGMGAISAYTTNLEMKGIAAASYDNFITSEKLNKSYSMLTQQLGVSADILGGEALVSATNLEQRLGMSAENASQLTVYSRLQGKSTEKVLSNSVATVGAFNKQNKTAINTRQVMDDVAGASKSMYLNMGKNVTAMAATATKARALGLSLAQVEKISESLLNFEDSIGKELEANLLLGGGVNLAKAREAALTGDTAKLTDEIGKQESIRNAFATKNVIAQKAAADALGISRDELAGMALQQDLNKLSAEEFKDRYGEATYESMKSRSATEKLGDAMDKVKDILGSIVQVFTPFLNLIAWVLANPIAPWFIAAAIAAKVLSSNISGVGKGFGVMYQLGAKALTGIAGLFKGGHLKQALGGLKDTFTGGFKAGAGGLKDKVMGGAADKTKDIAGKTGGADAKKGGGVGGFLKGLGDGLASMGKQWGDIIKGAIALGIAGIAIAGGLAIAMYIIKDVDPVKMLAFTGAISMLGLTLAVMGKIGGDVIKGALALGIVGIALIPAAYAFSLLKDVDTDKIIAFSIAVPLLALAAAGLGFLIGPIALGAIALAALGVGLVVVGAGFMVLTAGQAGFGLFNQLLGIMADKGVAAGLGLGATGIGMGLLGAAGLLAFPGMLLAGIALSMLIAPLTLLNAVAASEILPALSTTLMQIAAAAPGLLGVAASLFGIAAGLGAVALAGIMAIPAIGGLLALSVAAPALVALGIGGDSKSAGEAKGKSDKGSMEGVEKKLDALIMAVRAGGNVYLDTNKVGKAQVLGSYKLG